jgi:hypothetical protein
MLSLKPSRDVYGAYRVYIMYYIYVYVYVCVSIIYIHIYVVYVIQYSILYM